MSAHDEPSRRALAILRRQTMHMTRMVNDLLDIPRISHGRLHLERVIIDLNASVLTAVETIRQQAERKKHGFVAVTIKDTGIGIDPRDASALFKPYQQEKRPDIVGDWVLD